MMSSNSISPLPNRSRSIDYMNTDTKSNISIGGFSPSVYAVDGK